MSTRAISIVVLLALVALAWPVIAQPPAAFNFVAHLSGDEEVPPRDTLAQGQAIFHLSYDGTELDYQLMVANIENVVAAHIHCGAAGVNGPVVVFLFGPADPGGGRVNGVLAEGTITDDEIIARPDSVECPGGVADFDDLLAKMRTGNAYANVHTNDGVEPPNTGPGDFPGGEVRGQIDTAGP
jgi:hypothetical protein